jgi:hypothetical protein
MQRLFDRPVQTGSIGGMVLLSDNQIPWRQTCVSATVSTRNLIRTALDVAVDLSTECGKSVLRHGIAHCLR